jgi:hypothetical protein
MTFARVMGKMPTWDPGSPQVHLIKALTTSDTWSGNRLQPSPFAQPWSFASRPLRICSATTPASKRLWRQQNLSRIRLLPTAPNPTPTPGPSTPRRGRVERRGPATRKTTGPSTAPSPRERPTALPSRRRRARRTSESIKGGRGGGPGLSVPSPKASPCHDSLSICPRPTTIWRSGADCATSFLFGRRIWKRPLNFFRPWKGTILLSRPHRHLLIQELASPLHRKGRTTP